MQYRTAFRLCCSQSKQLAESWNWDASLYASSRFAPEGRVIEAADATCEELEALYGNALALLFPSFEEGFGWPILEAQACGCPVIASRRPPMTEVAGEAAILIDPAEPQAAAMAIAAGLKGSEQLRAAGFKNLKRFDAEAIADRYCAFYESILGHAPASAR